MKNVENGNLSKTKSESAPWHLLIPASFQGLQAGLFSPSFYKGMQRGHLIPVLWYVVRDFLINFFSVCEE